MQRWYIIQDIHTGLYFRQYNPPDPTCIPDAVEMGADFFTLDEALLLARKYYNKPPEIEILDTLCHIRLGTIEQYFKWLGRKGGRVKSEAKSLANQKKSKHKRRRTLTV